MEEIPLYSLRLFAFRFLGIVSIEQNERENVRAIKMERVNEWTRQKIEEQKWDKGRAQITENRKKNPTEISGKKHTLNIEMGKIQQAQAQANEWSKWRKMYV